MNLRMIDEHVYRSDQPNVEAWPLFFQAGVQGVMSFRQDGEDGGYSIKEEAEAVRAAGLQSFISIPVGEMPYNAPTEAQIVEALVRLRDGRTWIIHCRRGCDRTGVFAARYRMDRGWSMQFALAEAMRCGMSRFQFRMHEFLEASKVHPVAKCL